MKKLILSISIAFITQGFAQSKPKIKIPHLHNSAHGGSVLMFGDDHLEIKKGKGPAELEMYISDKFRNQVAAKDVQFQLAVYHGEHRMEVPATDIKTTSKEMMMDGKKSKMDVVTVDLKNQPKGTRLEIRLSRTEESKKTLPSGYITATSPQKVMLDKLLTLSGGGHEEHNM